MKKIIFFSLLLLSASTYAQEKVEKYCELIATAKMFSTKVTIEIDFGQEKKFFEFKDARIKDDLGKAKNFNSVVDALNYMGSLGWKFVDAYPLTEGGGSKVLHFFFKKEFLKSELTEGTAKADAK
ncbi:hypothetical protein [Chitinophaga barathri]|uniref:DUF4177 domain-containing protein n=1 Tax=Chitinophaga barathri TaxID=1647451 RepID=A0A3N4MD98_9BACT|nr:hypothetical protein [Chitinophaga barathri]RPD41548.1 hypothetical protein EG028_09580 [Chitinophaga barathri]